ncbi:hypothetical protein UCREL1_9382 [Eutypa lata UCREL1]|uniref:Uncharacterized protein n=1 Tax=Eutypa lata (strain UCR-EL1) TaxID=1287681 RepID=M7TAI6_EUTLA|nr:hypothetical protein UCREL1_9382 [Eutypa lata UCREL1]
MARRRCALRPIKAYQGGLGLLETGAPELSQGSSESALVSASAMQLSSPRSTATADNINIVKLQRHRRPVEPDSAVLTSIHPTIWFEPSKTIKKLIDKRLDFNAKTAEGTLFLYIAVRGNRKNSRGDSVCGIVRLPKLPPALFLDFPT